MSTESAFNKRLRPETTFDKIEAILEHLNLPPQFVELIRHNRKVVTTVVLVVIAAVIAGSLYSSYQERRVRQAASALSLAGDKSGEEKIGALEKVAADFHSTGSALWAQIEIAQEWMKEGEYQKAAGQYSAVLGDVKSTSLVYPLLVYGKAGALEGAKEWEGAVAGYTALQEIVGYEALGSLGVGRVYRQQGKNEEALAEYNNFLLKAGDDPRLQADRQAVEAEVARLKAVIGDSRGFVDKQ